MLVCEFRERYAVPRPRLRVRHRWLSKLNQRIPNVNGNQVWCPRNVTFLMAVAVGAMRALPIVVPRASP